MAAYRFYAPADAAQDKIWRDTVDTWGEAQAETYIRGLHVHLQRLCDNDLLWQRLPQRLAVPGDITLEAYFSRYRHHYVFFRKLDNGDPGLMSILHERMDMAVRLREDLAALDARGSIQTR
ncbi:type II toxin-antitoxin system RelE/ParE family toxin [Agrobacterium deltaense]|uniref:type II toxin-antitoxin system RelE/ParE family toxin n=1 Tax=Agrobacterium deltaense TaxID=1183412 RepID=UPI001C6DFB39|nr:type II toxin-antitoxin system RelE/ParE family toxin [Agrobacterium deltaense]MBW9073043.1 type II toxin-antitoxin system RelE/ParE family toxin [Agrobacterium deltaense]